MRKLLASLALVTAVATQAATNDTTWQYTPYSNEVTDIKLFRKSPNPLIWLGTNHGVVRIKGTDTLWLHPTNSKLPSEIIFPNQYNKPFEQATLTAMDSSGNYWIGYSSLRKLVKIDTAGTINVIDSSSTAPIGNLGGLAISKSTVYFANRNGKVYSRAIGSTAGWTLVEGSAQLDEGITLTALDVSQDTLWIGTDGNANGNLRYISQVTGAYGPFRDASGNRILTGVYGIWHSEAPTDKYMYLSVATLGSYGHITTDTLFSIAPNRSITKRLEDESGVVIHIRNQGSYPTFHKAGGIPISMDKDGFSWVGAFPAGIVAGAHDTGLTYFLGSSSLNGFYKLKVDRSNGWTTTPYGPSLRGTKIISSTAAANGTLFIATDSAVYQRTDAEPILSRIYSTTNAAIRSLSLDSAGKLNIGQSNGLFKWSNGGTSYVTAMSDSILAMAHSKTYSWYLTRTASTKATKLWVYTAGVTAPSQVLFTGFGADSTLITKMRALEDNTLWVLANGKVYTWTTASWKNWTGIAITGTGPGTGTFGNFDLAGNHLWTSFQTKGQYQAYSWGTATMANNSLIASGIDVNSTIAPVYAENDETAWYFNQQSSMMYTNLKSATELQKMSATEKKVVTRYTSETSNLHKGSQAPGDNLFSDKNGGLWIVMTDGVSRMKVTPQPVGIATRSTASTFASVQAGKLLFSLNQPTSVRFEILDLSGRVLERKNLGMLSEGAHAIALPKATGLRILQIKAGDRSETMRLPAL
jgi:ligand-binding sensor domain-containing protein